MDEKQLNTELEELIGKDKIGPVEFNNEAVSIRYSRDGLEREQKKELEDKIYNLLTSQGVTEDKIRIMATSDSKKKQTVKKERPQAKPAEAGLKTGHGPSMPKKKRVEGAKRVIAVSSGKGGVGKSTVSVNLALSLTNLGFKVGLIDADIYGPSVPTLLGQREAKPKANEDKKIMPVEAHGIKFISFGLFISEKDPVIWRGPMLGGVLNQFLFDVQWGELDYMIIDLPPGTGDMQLSMIQATEVDGAIVVSTPQQVALLDSQKGLEMFRQVKVPILGMVENMSYFCPDDDQSKKYFLFGEGGVKKACDILDVEMLGEIPMEIALRESCDEGQPYMANKEFQGRAVWDAYTSLAEKVSQLTGLHAKANGQKKGFLKGFFKS
jgi:ATP-binding protein involved in chromosome partitioning